MSITAPSFDEDSAPFATSIVHSARGAFSVETDISDRLCDFVRWQITHFAEFLDFAAQHGAEALTRRLTDEMFEVERRIKKEGRSAGGARPLRMWRGD